MPDLPDFTGDVRLEDLIKVFRAHGVIVDRVEVNFENPGSQRPESYVEFHKKDQIHRCPTDPVIYRGKAHWLARMFDVPLVDLYQPEKFKSA